MDGTGIDFVEGSFGSEPANSGAGRDQERAQAFQKWAKRTHEVPIKGILIALAVFVVMMGLPWILDCVQSSRVPQAQQPDPAISGNGWADETTSGPYGQPTQPHVQALPPVRQKVVVTR